jgi:uncharacterized protein YabE (DUF348 family)
LRKHPFVLPVSVFLLLFMVSAVAFIQFGSSVAAPSDSHIVILFHDKQTQTIPSHDQTVGDLIKRLKLRVNPGDVVEPSLDTQIVQDNFHVNIYRAQPVTVVDGTHKTATLSAAVEPRTVAAQAGVVVYPEDYIKPAPPDRAIKDGVVGEELVVDRAVPASINLYGTPINIRTHAKTVGEVIKEKKIALAAGDHLTPDAQTPVTAGMAIFVIRSGTQIITTEQAIPAPVQIVEDGSLTFGTTVVRQAGVAGKQVTTYQIQTKNGVEVSRQEIQVVVEVPPVPQIIARGKAVQIPSDKTSLMAAAGIRSSDYPFVDYIISHESGWCPTKLQGQVGYCPGYPPINIPYGLGYGLGQATPGSKMSSFGADWASNPITQLRWASSYANARFGSWGAAYNYWQAHRNW